MAIVADAVVNVRARKVAPGRGVVEILHEDTDLTVWVAVGACRLHDCVRYADAIWAIWPSLVECHGRDGAFAKVRELLA